MSESSDDRDPLDRLLEEFVASHRAGRRPSLTDFAARIPDRADEVRELFPALVELEQLKPGTMVRDERTGDGTADYEPLRRALDRPDRVGEYRILRLVARGGMGAVYEAVQESLGRHVALKLLPAEALADPRRLERFRREAKAAARLHHTNIVPVFGVGEADGRHFYAMQFIDGHPLDAVIDEVRRLKDKSTARSARAVSEVAASLMTGRFAAAVAQVSSTIADRPGESNGALDVAGLYELLTLQPAFRGEKRAKLVEEVIAAEPLKPRTINPAIPRDLETIVLKAIDRDPARRYQSATELGEDLRRFVEDRPIRARRATPTEQVVRWCRRNPAVAALIAVVMLAILAGAGVASVYAVRAEHVPAWKASTRGGE